ncbi:hypothetical protein [Qipengyuania atrilutea]|uniref:Uncharacterized protein n=1 Tax=Qipengyuania atrilutea TaxID=2744473 RepID=A0A850H625_9SPHN|nr:hypothetical protein [Actirhodobacter atriluteus]NVD46150.1 hypothetical protein [Actirhodobacter atriluteus]
MLDLTTALLIATVVLGLIRTAATLTGVIIQHRRTAKLPEPPITPTCTTVLGADIGGHVDDLPGRSRRRTLGRW